MTVDGRDVLVPMASEESSVIAAVCNSAKRCRSTGGFKTSTSGPLMAAQIQLLGASDPENVRLKVLERIDDIRTICEEIDPLLVKLGGGFRDLDIRVIDTAEGPMTIVHIIVDTRDAMGANAVNSMAEALAPKLEEWTAAWRGCGPSGRWRKSVVKRFATTCCRPITSPMPTPIERPPITRAS